MEQQQDQENSTHFLSKESKEPPFLPEDAGQSSLQHIFDYSPSEELSLLSNQDTALKPPEEGICEQQLSLEIGSEIASLLTPAEELEEETLLESLEFSLSEVETAFEHALTEEAQHDSQAPAVGLLEALLKQLSDLPDFEQKLLAVIAFMESTLSQTTTPHFKTFWEARNLCLELFKENITSSSRVALWSKYQELSKEARRLKEIYDEQSQFAAEQIDMAIKALENDIEQFSASLEKMPPSGFPQMPEFLRANLTDYDNLQKEINLLNVQAVRIGTLRKELLKTEMRVRIKNKFFQRLSSIGDKIFPRRKEIIKELSTQFTEDVEIFVERYFSSQVLPESLFVLREGIKALQSMAKALALNTAAFTVTRKQLSECWDSLKELERERKKVRNQKKSEWDKNSQEIQQQIDALQTKTQEASLDMVEVNRLIDGVVEMMRKLELGRDNLKVLRQKLNDIRTPLLEKLKSEEQKKQEALAESVRQRKQNIFDLRQQLDSALHSIEQMSAEALAGTISALSDALAGLGLAKSEKTEMERQLKRLRDALTEKEEHSLLSLSEDDAKTLLQIKEVLKQRKQRRKEIKEQLDLHRKAGCGASGLDFEQAILFNAHISAEKERLEKMDQGIKEIEERIVLLQRQAHGRS